MFAVCGRLKPSATSLVVQVHMPVFNFTLSGRNHIDVRRVYIV